MPDVAEHHPEHDHVGDPGEHRRVDVGVRHGPVGLAPAASNERRSRLAAQQGRRVDAAGARQRHQRRRPAAASRPASLGQRGPRDPAGERRHLRRRTTAAAALLQLRLPGEQVYRPARSSSARSGEGRQTAPAARRSRPRRAAAGGPGSAARARRSPDRRWSSSIAAGVGDLDQHVPQRRRRARPARPAASAPARPLHATASNTSSGPPPRAAISRAALTRQASAASTATAPSTGAASQAGGAQQHEGVPLDPRPPARLRQPQAARVT